MTVDIPQGTRYRHTDALERQDTTNETELRPLHGIENGGIPEPAWTERGTVKKQYLTTFEAASLIVNKMIGTGIFTTPGLVLCLAQSKTLAFAFWVIGGIYAATCLLVYLDYATGLPFNGAELIYLTRIYHSAKLKMLPPILFASFFILLYHTAGNALSFARYIIIAASAPNADGSYSPNPNLVKAFAICILAFVCFILWVSPRSGLVMSKTIALYKIVLLIVLGSWGISARTKTATSDWGHQQSLVTNNSIQRLSGFIYVAYAYNGWENSSYVIGQIDKSDFRWTKKIRWGSMLAVFLVSVSYGVLILGYYVSCSYDDINTNIIESSDLGIARVFSNQVLHGTKGLAISIALSGFGNLIAVAYTQTKVKQAIALHHFLPFSTFLASDDPFNTPGGALLLHWLLSTVFILGTPTDADGYAFIIGLVTFGQLIIATFVGLGRFRLSDAIRRAKLDTQGWKPWIHSRMINYTAGFVLAGVNVVLLVSASWPTPPLSTEAKMNSQIPRYYWPVVLASCLVGGIVYWSVLRLLQGCVGRWFGWVWEIKQSREESEFDQFRRFTRRDGTEERYHNTVKRGPAKWIREGWYHFWRFLGDNL